LIPIFEEGYVHEFNEEDRNVILVDEESCEEHERHNEDGCECDSQLFVREQRADDKRIASRGDVDDNDDGQKHGELVGKHGRQSDDKVHHAPIDDGSNEGGWQFRSDLREEVGRHIVHVVVHFPQKHRPLIRKDQYYSLDCQQSHVQRYEEQCSISVLHTLQVIFDVVVEDYCEEGGDDDDQQFHCGGLRKAILVQEVSFQQETELITPSLVAHRSIFLCQSCNSLRHLLVLVLQFTLLVFFHEVVDLLFILLLNGSQ